jgi:hypothetical protein
MQGWALLHSDGNPIGAEMVKSRLEAAGISVVILNKRDSSYGMFGTVEVHVPEAELEHAKACLTEPRASEDEDGQCAQ